MRKRPIGAAGLEGSQSSPTASRVTISPTCGLGVLESEEGKEKRSPLLKRKTRPVPLFKGACSLLAHRNSNHQPSPTNPSALLIGGASQFSGTAGRWCCNPHSLPFLTVDFLLFQDDVCLEWRYQRTGPLHACSCLVIDRCQNHGVVIYSDRTLNILRQIIIGSQ